MHWFTECRHAITWGKNLCEEIFKSKHLGYLSLIALMAMLLVGVALFIVDPNIKSPVDGVWSALSTITHVGFGDVIPVSFLGRLLSAGLILLGLILFPLFTALVSVILIGKNIETLGVGQIKEEACRLQVGENKITEEFARLHERIDKLEKSLINQDTTPR